MSSGRLRLSQCICNGVFYISNRSNVILLYSCSSGTHAQLAKSEAIWEAETPSQDHPYSTSKGKSSTAPSHTARPPGFGAFVFPLRCSPAAHPVTQHLFLILQQLPPALWGKRRARGDNQHLICLVTCLSGYRDLGHLEICLIDLGAWGLNTSPSLRAQRRDSVATTDQSAGSVHNVETDTCLFKLHIKALYPVKWPVHHIWHSQI